MMKKTTQYFEDESMGQYTIVEDAPMVKFLNKLRELTGTEHVKLYWRKHRNYREECDMFYIYGQFIGLKHEVTLANSCGAGGRRIWLEHRYQKNSGEAIGPLYIMSDAQIDAFDALFAAWMAAGQDVTDSDWAVAEEIMAIPKTVKSSSVVTDSDWAAERIVGVQLPTQRL